MKENKIDINPTNQIRLAVIWVEYDRRKYGDSFSKLREYLRKIENCQLTYIRVDNRHEDIKPMRIENDVYKVGGDNRYREFSGWQKGIAASNLLNISHDVFLFVNEAFLKPGESFLKDYADIALLRKVVEDNAIIGRIDTFGRKHFVYGYDVSNWICTNCFFTPKTAVDKVGDIVSVKDNINDFIDDNYNKNHLIINKEVAYENIDGGHFTLKADIDQIGSTEFRIVLDKSFIPKDWGLSDDERNLGLSLKNFQIGDQDIKSVNFKKGFYNCDVNNWIARTAYLRIPDNSGKKMVIKGYIPPDIFNMIYNNNLKIKVYNDSVLFRKNAPINLTYKRSLIEWLTERWHSSFEINQKTWHTFRSKVAGILNEVLLSVKFAEVGYKLQNYGNKKYY